MPIIIALILFFWFRHKAKKNFRDRVSLILNELSDSYRRKYFISSNNKSYSSKANSNNNPMIGYFDKFYLYGAISSNSPSIRGHIKFLTWVDHHESEDENTFAEKFNDTFFICEVHALLETSKDSIEKEITEKVRTEYGGFVDDISIEGKLCDILFLNWPEVKWSANSILELQEPLAEMTKIYRNSIENELMNSFRDKALKAMNQMTDEVESLEAYMNNSFDAMKKAYQYLSIPSAMRTFENISLDPLRVYVKSEEMREAFENGVAIQRELEKLQ